MKAILLVDGIYEKFYEKVGKYLCFLNNNSGDPAVEKYV